MVINFVLKLSSTFLLLRLTGEMQNNKMATVTERRMIFNAVRKFKVTLEIANG